MKEQRRLTRQESQQLTRERLLEAAERVFIRAGFEGSSVEEITAEAGFSRGAFYSNFSSKDELFLKLLQKRSAELLDRVEQIFAQPYTHEQRVAAMREFFLEQCRASNWSILRAEFQMRALRNAELREFLTKMYSAELDSYAARVGDYFVATGTAEAQQGRVVAMALMELADALSFRLSTKADADEEKIAGTCAQHVFDRLLCVAPLGHAGQELNGKD